MAFISLNLKIFMGYLQSGKPGSCFPNPRAFSLICIMVLISDILFVLLLGKQKPNVVRLYMYATVIIQSFAIDHV